MATEGKEHGRLPVEDFFFVFNELNLDAKSLQSCLTRCNPRDRSWSGSRPCDSPGKNTGVGCHFLLQGIFQTQGSNPYLLSSPELAGRFFTTSTTREALVGFLDINLAEETGPYRLLVSLSCFT